MYWYYHLTTIGLSPWWKKYITSMQIVQFTFACASAPQCNIIPKTALLEFASPPQVCSQVCIVPTCLLSGKIVLCTSVLMLRNASMEQYMPITNMSCSIQACHPSACRYHYIHGGADRSNTKYCTVANIVPDVHPQQSPSADPTNMYKCYNVWSCDRMQVRVSSNGGLL